MKRLYRPLTVLVIALIVVAALPLSAQEETEGPPQVGLRPDAPPYALHGPYWVGTTEFVIEDEERPLPVTVWYPALNPGGAEEAVTYTYDHEFVSLPAFTQEGRAIAHAAPDIATAPYPLVIISHGTVVYRYAHAYLAEHLASHGFVVMAADHTGDTLAYAAEPELRRADFSGFFESFLPAFVNCPADIQRQIDYAASMSASGGDLAGLIDIDHIAVIGHSAGGYTALASAGARVDLGPWEDWCVENAENAAMTSHWVYTLICSYLLPSEGQLLNSLGFGVNPGEMWPPFDVTGVDAVVPISPGPHFSPESFEQMTVPTLLLVGSKDSIPRLYEDTVMTYGSLPSDHKGLVVFENADHLFPLSRCSPWFYEHEYLGGCASESVWDMDRAHDLINHFTTAFLLATLKDDANAAAALAPDAVNFPGITYETTMGQ